jgi:hypothetical protein
MPYIPLPPRLVVTTKVNSMMPGSFKRYYLDLSQPGASTSRPRFAMGLLYDLVEQTLLPQRFESNGRTYYRCEWSVGHIEWPKRTMRTRSNRIVDSPGVKKVSEKGADALLPMISFRKPVSCVVDDGEESDANYLLYIAQLKSKAFRTVDLELAESP